MLSCQSVLLYVLSYFIRYFSQCNYIIKCLLMQATLLGNNFIICLEKPIGGYFYSLYVHRHEIFWTYFNISLWTQIHVWFKKNKLLSLHISTTKTWKKNYEPIKNV